MLTEKTTISLGVVGTLVACGVAWGAHTARLDALEAENASIVQDARELRREVLDRLNRLDKKMDRVINKRESFDE